MAQDKQGSQVQVAKNDSANQFEITYPDSGERAGLARYLDHNSERIFFHTEVSEEFGGRGLAGILVGEALNATTAEGMGIVAVCPFVKGFLDKNGHDGAHRAPSPADLQVLQQQLGG